jgi:hypothetical protein
MGFNVRAEHNTSWFGVRLQSQGKVRPAVDAQKLKGEQDL